MKLNPPNSSKKHGKTCYCFIELMYENNYDKLKFSILRKTKDDEFAEDVVSEVFLNLLEKCEQGRLKLPESKKEFSFLLSAVNNKFIDLIRKRNKERTIPIQTLRNLAVESNVLFDMNSKSKLELWQEIILDFIQSLPKVDQIVMECKVYYDDLKYDEILQIIWSEGLDMKRQLKVNTLAHKFIRAKNKFKEECSQAIEQ